MCMELFKMIADRLAHILQKNPRVFSKFWEPECWCEESCLLRIYIYLMPLHIEGLSGKYPAILNISRTGRVALV
jgi:hypothetical protein